MKFFVPTVLIMLAAATALAGDEIDMTGLDPVFAERLYSPYAKRAYPESVYFGDTHVNTGLSADVGGSGTRLLPRDAYRFAHGEQITLNTGQPVKLRTSFDFFMITDHSDGMCAITDMISGTPDVMADPSGKMFHEELAAGGDRALSAARELFRQFMQGEASPALNHQPGNPAYKRVWDDIIQAAEEFNDPGHFTTFMAYEWTSLEKGNNLHRNVIFRDGPERAGRVVPYTTTPPSGHHVPKGLWKRLENYKATTGCDVTAIAHNGNLSNGMMFALQDDFAEGAAYDTAYAEQRNKWERLYEATRIKGDGGAHPLLSPDVEFAHFENWDWGNLDISKTKTQAMMPGVNVRSGLQRGMELETELGIHPCKFGLVEASDTHTGLSTPDNDIFFGKFNAYEPIEHRANHLSRRNDPLDIEYSSWRYIIGSLTAGWATSSTCSAIFDAMEPREVYATIGPRMRVGFFGGWDFTSDDANRRGLAVLGYRKGVPMATDLLPGEGAPSFLVYALRDPRGANLDRVQIEKGWLEDDGTPREKVYDVAWSECRVPVRASHRYPDAALDAV